MINYIQQHKIVEVLRLVTYYFMSQKRYFSLLNLHKGTRRYHQSQDLHRTASPENSLRKKIQSSDNSNDRKNQMNNQDEMESENSYDQNSEETQFNGMDEQIQYAKKLEEEIKVVEAKMRNKQQKDKVIPKLQQKNSLNFIDNLNKLDQRLSKKIQNKHKQDKLHLNESKNRSKQLVQTNPFNEYLLYNINHDKRNVKSKCDKLNLKQISQISNFVDNVFFILLNKEYELDKLKEDSKQIYKLLSKYNKWQYNKQSNQSQQIDYFIIKLKQMNSAIEKNIQKNQFNIKKFRIGHYPNKKQNYLNFNHNQFNPYGQNTPKIQFSFKHKFQRKQFSLTDKKTIQFQSKSHRQIKNKRQNQENSNRGTHVAKSRKVKYFNQGKPQQIRQNHNGYLAAIIEQFDIQIQNLKKQKEIVIKWLITIRNQKSDLLKENIKIKQELQKLKQQYSKSIQKYQNQIRQLSKIKSNLNDKDKQMERLMNLIKSFEIQKLNYIKQLTDMQNNLIKSEQLIMFKQKYHSMQNQFNQLLNKHNFLLNQHQQDQQFKIKLIRQVTILKEQMIKKDKSYLSDRQKYLIEIQKTNDSIILRESEFSTQMIKTTSELLRLRQEIHLYTNKIKSESDKILNLQEELRKQNKKNNEIQKNNLQLKKMIQILNIELNQTKKQKNFINNQKKNENKTIKNLQNELFNKEQSNLNLKKQNSNLLKSLNDKEAINTNLNIEISRLKLLSNTNLQLNTLNNKLKDQNNKFRLELQRFQKEKNEDQKNIQKLNLIIINLNNQKQSLNNQLKQFRSANNYQKEYHALILENTRLKQSIQNYQKYAQTQSNNNQKQLNQLNQQINQHKNKNICLIRQMELLQKQIQKLKLHQLQNNNSILQKDNNIKKLMNQLAIQQNNVVAQNKQIEFLRKREEELVNELNYLSNGQINKLINEINLRNQDINYLVDQINQANNHISFQFNTINELNIINTKLDLKNKIYQQNYINNPNSLHKNQIDLFIKQPSQMLFIQTILDNKKLNTQLDIAHKKQGLLIQAEYQKDMYRIKFEQCNNKLKLMESKLNEWKHIVQSNNGKNQIQLRYNKLKQQNDDIKKKFESILQDNEKMHKYLLKLENYNAQLRQNEQRDKKIIQQINKHLTISNQKIIEYQQQIQHLEAQNQKLYQQKQLILSITSQAMNIRNKLKQNQGYIKNLEPNLNITINELKNVIDSQNFYIEFLKKQISALKNKNDPQKSKNIYQTRTKRSITTFRYQQDKNNNSSPQKSKSQQSIPSFQFLCFDQMQLRTILQSRLYGNNKQKNERAKMLMEQIINIIKKLRQLEAQMINLEEDKNSNTFQNFEKPTNSIIRPLLPEIHNLNKTKQMLNEQTKNQNSQQMMYDINSLLNIIQNQRIVINQLSQRITKYQYQANNAQNQLIQLNIKNNSPYSRIHSNQEKENQMIKFKKIKKIQPSSYKTSRQQHEIHKGYEFAQQLDASEILQIMKKQKKIQNEQNNSIDEDERWLNNNQNNSLIHLSELNDKYNEKKIQIEKIFQEYYPDSTQISEQLFKFIMQIIKQIDAKFITSIQKLIISISSIQNNIHNHSSLKNQIIHDYILQVQNFIVQEDQMQVDIQPQISKKQKIREQILKNKNGQKDLYTNKFHNNEVSPYQKVKKY